MKEFTQIIEKSGFPKTTITSFGRTPNSAKANCQADCRRYVKSHKEQRVKWIVAQPRDGSTSSPQRRGLRNGYVPLSQSTVLEIKKSMKEQKISLLKLAQITGVPHSTLNGFLNFHCKSCLPENLQKIKKAVGLND